MSIQGRLTALYAGALLAALTVCGIGLYLSVVRLELSSIDEDLQRAASTIAFSMKAEEREGLDLRAAAADTEAELRIAGITLAIYDANGQLLAARWEDFDPKIIQRTDLQEGLTTMRIARGEWRRMVTRESYKGTDYLVLNALPLDLVSRHTGMVRTAFLTIVPVTFALAVGGGWFLARSTLRPVIESQRRFMADASHELRTPVSVIRSAADVTLSQPQRSTAEYRDSVSIIAEQARRLSRLVDDLFLLARSDVKARPLATARFYLDDVLRECMRGVELLGASRKIRFELSALEDVEIDADEDLLRRMLMNLLENAVRHTGVGTTIRVELTRQNGRIEIAVRDQGTGIPAEHRDRIFERFVRLESAPGGAGLGLPIARWIAEAHGGSLTLAESSQAGSRF
ncbi:MAG TPA: HAMP domain-containing sensor histidine kinase, partial [Vicinamibacterales bacterium]|nr:HAMP domain-containing sensor histidine kinase [Vicinamibacterales bacterium]